MGLAAQVGAALNFVATSTACEGLALKQIPMLGVWSAPADAHDLPTFWAGRVIVCAERAGACL